jgi:hypothetical protein
VALKIFTALALQLKIAGFAAALNCALVLQEKYILLNLHM